jgi:RNA polymerase sigma-70 factor (sigma-E family)
VILKGDTVKQADRQEFEVFAAGRMNALRRTAYLLCGSWSTADDLTQATLVKMYVAWPRITKRGTVDRYAHRVLTRAWLDEVRSARHRREVVTDDVPEGVAIPSPGELDRDEILHALSSLAPRQRAVVVLRFWDDLSVAQTADALGCSVGTVKSQTAHALQKLRRRLEDPTLLVTATSPRLTSRVVTRSSADPVPPPSKEQP